MWKNKLSIVLDTRSLATMFGLLESGPIKLVTLSSSKSVR